MTGYIACLTFCVFCVCLVLVGGGRCLDEFVCMCSDGGKVAACLCARMSVHVFGMYEVVFFFRCVSVKLITTIGFFFCFFFVAACSSTRV